MWKGEVINHKRGDCVWFHTTPLSRWGSIERAGLKINSPPTWQTSPEPWIYVSTEPFSPGENNMVLEVDLSWLSTEDCGWPFLDGRDDPDWDNRWQLRVFRDIPPEYIRRRKCAL